MSSLAARLRRLGTARVMRCAVLAGAVALMGACSTHPDTVDYATGITTFRSEKDTMFRESSESPVSRETLDQFVPLAYYPIDEAFRVPAALTALSDAESPAFEMPTSTGQRRQMRRAGKLRFTLKGETHTLTAFVSAEDTARARLFVPFRDLTAGVETYTAGRYLDLDRTATGLYDLDFNRAYQPYCYYDVRYDCPIPPAENRLSLPIRAGERMRPE